MYRPWHAKSSPFPSSLILTPHPTPTPFPVSQLLGRQSGTAGWPGEQVLVAAAAQRYVLAAVKLAARGQYSKRDGEGKCLRICAAQ